MEEKFVNVNNIYDLRDGIAKVREDIQDIRNIVQLLEVSLSQNQDDNHIIQTVHIIDKMLATLIMVDMVTLENIIFHE